MTTWELFTGSVLAGLLAAAPLSAAAQDAGSVLTVANADEPGTRLTLNGTVVDDQGRPVAGAQIHISQTDDSGYYTKERAMDEENARLSGWVRTDAQGHFEIRTIRPGSYPQGIRIGDRQSQIPAHIHIVIKAPGSAGRTLQAIFADDPLLTDPHWKEWAKRPSQLVVSVRPSSTTGGVSGKLRVELGPSGHK